MSELVLEYREKESVRQYPFGVKLLFLYVLNVVDWFCTQVLIDTGYFHEANPLMMWIMDYPLVGFGNCFNKHKRIGGGAAGCGSGGIHFAFVNPVEGSGTGKILQNGCNPGSIHKFVAAVCDKAFTDSDGCVGHDPDDRNFCTDYMADF